MVGLAILLSETQEEKSGCKKDSDCIVQQVTCCPCSMGGKEECMSKTNASYWKEKLAEECEEDIVCPAVYRCMGIECKCIEGNCKEFRK
jgi:hypothetical protein